MSAPLHVTSPAIWLTPYVQLKATAREAWERDYPDRLMPQIMTVREWAASLGVITKAPSDIHFDAGIDRLIAESLLRRAGMSTDSAFVQRLLDMAHEAAPALAALEPSRRVVWAAKQSGLFQQGGQFGLEGAIGFAALMWAATTNYDTDVLWQRQAALLASTEHFYVTTGLQQDALVQAILGGASSKTSYIDLGALPEAMESLIEEHIAQDSEDLVQQTAALVLQSQTQAQVQSIALVALDRQITRRVSSVLANRGVTIADETGWALSTSSVAAHLMAWLEAMDPKATSNMALAAFKCAPARFLPADVAVLEKKIRANAWTRWSQTSSDWLGDWPLRFARARKAADWIGVTCELLQHVGLWDAMQADEAGKVMLEALHLDETSLLGLITHFKTPMSQSAYLAWVRAVLEANRFRLKWSGSEAVQVEQAAQMTVIVLPLEQLWGRHFDAVIAAGVDERRLPARPAVTSDWSAAQRELLALPTADDEAASRVKAWAWLCAQPRVNLLWQQMDGAEVLQKSSLVQLLEMEGRLFQQMHSPSAVWQESVFASSDTCQTADGEYIDRNDVFKNGVAIDWKTLAPTQLSASSYADLRACPYRFYAKNILGLRDFDELDDTVDKRDFGSWLHSTLYKFHEELKILRQAQDEPNQTALGDADQSVRAEPVEALLVRCGLAAQRQLGLDDAAFLPFALIWEKTRKAYLVWLDGHEASGATYQAGEVEKSFELEVQGKTVRLFGKLDRIDVMGDGATADGLLLLDYKTEAIDKTKRRIKDSHEDTQLAFYRLLAEHGADSAIRAAYVNLTEGAKDTDVTTTHELLDVEAHSQMLFASIESDLARMARGHGLRALGEGDACTYCNARGLCRKDFR